MKIIEKNLEKTSQEQNLEELLPDNANEQPILPETYNKCLLFFDSNRLTDSNVESHEESQSQTTGLQ